MFVPIWVLIAFKFDQNSAYNMNPTIKTTTTHIKTLIMYNIIAVTQPKPNKWKKTMLFLQLQAIQLLLPLEP